jgi:hypothetical protein
MGLYFILYPGSHNPNIFIFLAKSLLKGLHFDIPVIIIETFALFYVLLSLVADDCNATEFLPGYV